MHKDGVALLTDDIERNGEHSVLDAIVTRIAEGEDPKDIARSRGYTWYVLRRWMEEKPERLEAWALAKRCFADGLAYEALRETRDANAEEIAVSKLRSENYTKMAGRLSKREWGDAKDVTVVEGLTMDEALGGFAGMLLAKMRVVESVPERVSEKEGVENLAAKKNLPVVVDDVEWI